MSIVDGLVVIVAILAITMTVWLWIQRSSYDGKVVIELNEETGRMVYRLELDTDPYKIEQMKSVSFKVDNRQKIA